MKRVISFLLFFHSIIFGHGFGEHTFIKKRLGWSASIKQECLYFHEEDCFVASYNSEQDIFSHQKVVAAGYSEVPFYIRLRFDNCHRHNINCSAFQEFYVPLTGEWVPAHKLEVGDYLLTADDQLIELIDLVLVHEPLAVYAIEVEHTHTYFVGPLSVLTHNIIIPPLVIGFSIPFGTGIAGGLCGSFFGAPVITAGIAGGLLAGYLLPKIIGSLGMRRYSPHASDFDEEHVFDGLLLHHSEKQKSSTQNRSKTGYNQGSSGPDDPEKKKDEHPHGRYEDAPYHHKNSSGIKNPSPSNGQKALDNSLKVEGKNSHHRISAIDQEFVVLKKTSEDLFHGYKCTWKELDIHMQNTLINAGRATRKGKII